MDNFEQIVSLLWQLTLFGSILDLLGQFGVLLVQIAVLEGLSVFYIYRSRCTVIRTFFGYISNRPKKLCNDFFWGTEDLILVQLTLIIQKISKKVDFCHFFRDVLSLGWGGMGVLWCNRLNYSLQMGQI